MTRDVGEVFKAGMEWDCTRCGRRTKVGEQVRRVGFARMECEVCPAPKKSAAAKAAPQAALW